MFFVFVFREHLQDTCRNWWVKKKQKHKRHPVDVPFNQFWDRQRRLDLFRSNLLSAWSQFFLGFTFIDVTF